MAKLKGRDVTIDTHIPPEYKVKVRHLDDNTVETVDLFELTLTKKEAIDFIKGEYKRLEQEKDKHDKVVAAQEKLDAENKKALARGEPVKTTTVTPPIAPSINTPLSIRAEQAKVEASEEDKSKKPWFKKDEEKK